MNRQFVLTTERLVLLPLTPDQLRNWIHDLKKLENELDCHYQAEPMKDFFLDILKSQSAITDQDPDHYLFHSFWFLIRKKDRTVIGSADFKDLPDPNGQVEIGYGLGPDFEHQGYMTEAVQAMTEWALNQPGIQAVIAETYKDGFASQRVLQRCGFQLFQENETCWWRIVRNN